MDDNNFWWKKLNQWRKAFIAALAIALGEALIIFQEEDVERFQDFTQVHWTIIILSVLVGGGATWGVRNGASPDPSHSTPQA